MKVLITGANGQVGRSLQDLQPNHVQLISLTKEELDITNTSALHTTIQTTLPDFVINAAAYTAVDLAESERPQALAINAKAPKQLAIICHELDIPMIHLSTDYVFSGNTTSPYQENNNTNPVNYYGETKLQGEQHVRERLEKHIIIRTSGVFSPYRNNFVKTIIRLAQTKEELSIVNDQMTCPTSAYDIAKMLYRICKNYQTSPEEFAWGTYHYCNQPALTWYEFACHIIELLRLHHSIKVKDIKAILSSQYPTPAKRPGYSVLDCTKIQNTFSIEPLFWDSFLEKIILV